MYGYWIGGANSVFSFFQMIHPMNGKTYTHETGWKLADDPVF